MLFLLMVCRQNIDRKVKITVISHFTNSLNIISLNPFISDISARKQYFSGRFMYEVVADIRFRTDIFDNKTIHHTHITDI